MNNEIRASHILIATDKTSEKDALVEINKLKERIDSGESFAEIFAGNCKAIGLPVVYASRDEIKQCVSFISNHPETMITINLVSKRVRYFEESFLISMPDPQRESFLKGTWNVLDLLKKNSHLVADLDANLPY